MAYHVQMVRSEGHTLGPAHLLYLATAAGARGRSASASSPGTSARQGPTSAAEPPARPHARNGPRGRAADWDAALGAIFTLAREESIALRVRVGGDVVYAR